MPESFFLKKKVVPLHRNKALGYGVMVTLQILVLSFKVRVLVAQQRGSVKRISFFFYIKLRVCNNFKNFYVELLL